MNSAANTSNGLAASEAGPSQNGIEMVDREVKVSSTDSSVAERGLMLPAKPSGDVESAEELPARRSVTDPDTILTVQHVSTYPLTNDDEVSGGHNDSSTVEALDAPAQGEAEYDVSPAQRLDASESKGLPDMANTSSTSTAAETSTAIQPFAVPIPDALAKEGSARSDLDIVTQQAEDVAQTELASPNEELKRLRGLVFASRGNKSQLPEGWEDEQCDRSMAAELSTSAAAATAASVEDEPILKKALAQVGGAVSESESESDENDSSSESSTASSKSEVEQHRKPRPALVAYTGSDDEEDEDGKGGSGRGPMTKNEVIEPTIDAPPYSVVPQEKDIRPLGRIHSIVDSVVVISQDTGKAPGADRSAASYESVPVDKQGRRGEQTGEYSVLDTGSLLTFEDRNVLGVIFETFGSVLEPLYALRFQSAEQVNANVIYVGKPVYYVPADSTYVLTRALRAMGKGSDASNVWDEEVGDDERDFSDDEAEAEYKRNVKASKRQDGSAVPTAASSASKNARRAHNAASPMQGQRQQGYRLSSSYLPPASHNAPVMHPDVDLGITRSAPLPYDDETSGMTSAGARYSPYQHIHPRGAGSYAGQDGGARGRGRGAGSHIGYSAYPSATYNAHSAQQQGYATSATYAPYQQHQQQQGYSATAISPAWSYYQAGTPNGSTQGASIQQAPYHYPILNAQLPQFTATQTPSDQVQHPKTPNGQDLYDPSQPQY